MRAPGLLAALARDFSPTLSALGGGGGQAFFSARGTHGNNAGDAELGGFLDQPLEAVELDERGEQSDGWLGGFGGEGLEDAERDTLRTDVGDFREISTVVVGKLVALAGLGAQDAREVPGIVAGQLSLAAVYPVYKKSPPRQGAIVQCSLTDGTRRGRGESVVAGDAAVDRRERLSYHEAQPMIAVLRGVLVEKHPNQAVVDAGGVGYELHIPITTYTRLPEVGAEVRLRVYTHVREDTLALYGFLSLDEKTLFEKLIGVSGIGPSLAIKILSGLAAADLITAIRKGELERLVRIPGVGKKTAERMVLELRDKLPTPAGDSTAPPAPSLSEVEQDVLSALANLGCARPAAEQAIRKAKAGGAPGDFEPLFRRALELVR